MRLRHVGIGFDVGQVQMETQACETQACETQAICIQPLIRLKLTLAAALLAIRRRFGES